MRAYPTGQRRSGADAGQGSRAARPHRVLVVQRLDAVLGRCLVPAFDKAVRQVGAGVVGVGVGHLGVGHPGRRRVAVADGHTELPRLLLREKVAPPAKGKCGVPATAVGRSEAEVKGTGSGAPSGPLFRQRAAFSFQRQASQPA